MNDFPIIASITKEEQVANVSRSRVRRVNLMAGNILNLGEIVAKLHDAGKLVYVHVEMVQGLGRDPAAVQYLAEKFRVDGIISTKSGMISAAKGTKLRTIQRVFAIDSGALETAVKMIASCHPDEIELMPALMPRIIREMKSKVDKPLIAGGLIKFEEEIRSALQHGADFVSVGNPQFWQ